MAPYTQDELEVMMADLESDLVERKESLQGDNPRKIRQAVCAFANDLPDHQRPGIVFVGADDAGAPVGLEITDELLLQLADVKTDGNIVPPPTLTVDRRVLLGTPVAVVTVMPSDTPPVRHRGRIWIRVGPRRASAQDERILNEKRRHRDPHFDAQPVPTARVADLDLRRFEEEYLPLAVDAAALAGNDRSVDQRLAALKMIAGVDDPRPTIAGILVLGRNPQDFLPAAYAQFLRIAGTDLADPVVDEGRCSGPIAHLVHCLDDKLLAHNRTAVDFTSGPTETRTPTYPMAALQQLVRNAVMHRTYEGTKVVQKGAAKAGADIVLVDVGPSLGAINRSALIAADHVAVPLAADLFSRQGLRNLGPTLRRWRPDWKKRRNNWADPDFDLPAGDMQPIGYLIQQHGVRLSRPVAAYDRWARQMPGEYARSVLGIDPSASAADPESDEHCIATVKHYRSLVPLARDARKPIFSLSAGDGALGSHAAAARAAFGDFRTLVENILQRTHAVAGTRP